jgi:LPXTG-motif cell wall-anchored protein
MRNKVLTATAIAVLAVSGISFADEYDKKTEITVNEPVMVPGKTLSPGKYVMKLANITGNRHVVQIFNEDQSELQATIMAIPNFQVQRKEDTVVTFWETPAGSPRAMRAWFYPGDNHGQEFAYPKDEAERIARSNADAKVPQYEGEFQADHVADVSIQNEPAPLESKDAEVTVAQSEIRVQEPTPASAPSSPSATSRTESGVNDNASREVAVAPQPETPAQAEVVEPRDSVASRESSNDVIAQSTPAPAPQLRDEDTRLDNQRIEQSELPQTASPMPWVLLIGLGAMASAFVLRRLSA